MLECDNQSQAGSAKQNKTATETDTRSDTCPALSIIKTNTIKISHSFLDVPCLMLLMHRSEVSVLTNCHDFNLPMTFFYTAVLPLGIF